MIRTFVDILGDFDNNLEEIVGKDPYIKKISTKNLNFEVGKKFHRLHAHFILSIQHYVNKYSISKLRERIKDWMDENGRALEKSWAVYLTLAPTFKENYASKEARKLKADQLEDKDPEELERLSDGREEKTYKVHNKEVSALSAKEILSVAETGKRTYNTPKKLDLVAEFDNLKL